MIETFRGDRRNPNIRKKRDRQAQGTTYKNWAKRYDEWVGYAPWVRRPRSAAETGLEKGLTTYGRTTGAVPVPAVVVDGEVLYEVAEIMKVPYSCSQGMGILLQYVEPKEKYARLPRIVRNLN